MPRRADRRRAAVGIVGPVMILILSACSGSSPAASEPSPTPSAPASPSSAAVSPSASADGSCALASPPATLGDLVRDGPTSGAWVGLNIDWDSQTVAEVTALLGRPPADVVSFVSFPLTADDQANLDAAAGQARDAGAMLVVTLQPWGGLDAVTAQAATDIARRLATYGAEGVPTLVRFAHEMNGSWYPWGQDPAAYIAAFGTVAEVVHRDAPTAGLVWAPNQGDGYPYLGGEFEVVAGSAAAAALDTNGDGAVTPADDPYAPYWPGPDAVDWVGMSLYFWGLEAPWGENEVPLEGTFAAQMNGTGSTPGFYEDYAARYSKPLAIIETAAFFRPDGGGASESDIKTTWLDQVFSPETRAQFPELRMVNWFEWRKTETEVQAVVDWRIMADPGLRSAFLTAAQGAGFELGPVVPPGTVPVGCADP